MAGLIVIDFIDMESGGNDKRVERCLKESLKHDRARIQVGRISPFGLLEMSRQRLRTGLLEATSHGCPMCDGTGLVRTVPAAAMTAMRLIEEEAARGRASRFRLRADADVAFYISNRKRAEVAELEQRYGVEIEVLPEPELVGGRFAVDTDGPPPAFPAPTFKLPAPVRIADEPDVEEDEDDGADEPRAARGESERTAERGGRGRRRRRRGGRREDEATDAPLDGDTFAEPIETGSAEPGATDDALDEIAATIDADEGTPEERDGRRRRRRRGRGRRGEGTRENGGDATLADGGEDALVTADAAEAVPVDARVAGPVLADDAEDAPALAIEPEAIEPEPELVLPKPRRGRPRKVPAEPAPVLEPEPELVAEQPAEPAPKRKRAPARKKPETVTNTAAAAVPVAVEEPELPATVEAIPDDPAPVGETAAEAASPDPSRPARRGWWQRTFGE